jgi:hypothetical protein
MTGDQTLLVKNGPPRITGRNNHKYLGENLASIGQFIVTADAEIASIIQKSLLDCLKLATYVDGLPRFGLARALILQQRKNGAAMSLRRLYSFCANHSQEWSN